MWCGGEFWVELVGDELWMFWGFDYFYQGVVVGVVGNFQVGLFQLWQQVVVYFVVMVMVFDDYVFGIVVVYQGVGLQLVFLGVQVYGVVQVGSFGVDFGGVGCVLLFGDQVDYWMVVGFVEFGGVGVVLVEYVVGVFDDCDLYVQVDVQVGDFVFVGVLYGVDFVFYVVQVEVVWDQDGVDVFQQVGVLLFDVFGVDVVQVDFGVVLDVGVGYCFDQ